MISLIVPCYNEEGNVKLFSEEFFPVIEKLSKEFREEFEYVFIDDGSTDNTLESLKNLTKGLQHVKIIPHGRNRGLGAAIKTGIAHAEGDLLVCMDADLTYKPEYIADLIKSFRETQSDCISASPYLRSGDIRDVAAHRLFLSRLINLIYSILLGENVTVLSGIFRLYKREILRELKLESDNFDINAEILAKLIINKKKIQEIPVPLYKRRYGYSKINIRKEILNNLRLLLKIIKMKYFYQQWK